MSYLTVVWLCMPFFFGLPGAFADEKLGDVSDGGRSVSVHVMPLLTEGESDGEGEQIYADDEPLLPFSTRQTCGECHSYATIRRGWHFNDVEPNVAAGRAGHPWILSEPGAATQIALSYRRWPGTFAPKRLGMTPAAFVRFFGRQMPGGGPGEMVERSDEPEEVLRGYVTGPLEINCLACHDAHYGYDQSEFAVQIARQNFRWAATAASEFASVTGSTAKVPNMFDFRISEVFDDPKIRPPTVTYRKSAFDEKSNVVFDIEREVPNQRCYFCHSSIDAVDEQPEKWQVDEDIHISAGLKCVDCHRNGLDHNITRGYECEWQTSDNPLAARSSCEGCHLGDGSAAPVAGRFAAPVPEHPGIPPVHFEKLTCTACHSGPWPGQIAIRTKTAMAHAMGTLGSNKSVDMLPHIVYPVFAKNTEGKIGPYKLIWPAYWGRMKGDNVEPVKLDIVKSIAVSVFAAGDIPRSGDWPKLTDEQITKCLSLLASKVPDDAKAVYVAGGRVYMLDKNGKLTSGENDSARPYMWAVAHNVRSAAQSLGVRRCEDCHSTDSPVFFGQVPVDTPVVSVAGAARQMIDFQQLSRRYTWFFAFSFVFRPWLKVVVLLSAVVILGVLVLYALRALGFVARVFVGKD